jgi:hypothetical protein
MGAPLLQVLILPRQTCKEREHVMKNDEAH